MKTDSQTESQFEGLGVSPGIVIGPAYLVESGMEQMPEYVIPAKEIEAERQRFDKAVKKSLRQLSGLRAKARRQGGETSEELGFLLDAHSQMLTGSRLIRGVEREITDHKRNAEAAVQRVIHDITRQLSAVDDTYIAGRIDDVRDVGQRLTRNLLAAPYQAYSDLAPGTVILAEEITPADTALMDPAVIAGFASILGGAQGHTAIMARSLRLPAVLGVASLVTAAQTGDTVIVDGGNGVVIVNPKPETISFYRERQRELNRARRSLARLRHARAVTRDGVDITLQANLELPAEVDGARDAGAEGIGLLRSEFMFMNRNDLPSEDEQYAFLRDIVEVMEGRPVTIRTLDVGGEKLATSLGGLIVESENPALGLRAIRLSLSVPSLLEAQFAAMLRAGRHGPVRILLPMISTVAEIRRARQVFDRVVRRFNRRREPLPDPLPPLGAMIEVPGAALAADSLAGVTDFFSIGTNDLTMYTLAIDRGNDQVASLYDPLHPAVLRLIRTTVEAALRARIAVNLCGEMAGDARYSALLLGLGLRDLSMAPINLPPVKKRIRGVRMTEAARRTAAIMDQSDSGRIAAMLDDFNSLA